MKYSKLNEEQAAQLFEERKKQILGSLIQQYSNKSKKQQTNKNDIPSNKETQLKKIVKNTILKDIGCIDKEIQKMTKENINKRDQQHYLQKQHCQTKSINQTELSRSENIINRNHSYITNRQKNKINSLAENSYSKLAESIRNYSNQKKQEEPKIQDKAYDFLQIKSQSEKKIIKEKPKSVSIQKAPSKVISSERKIPKPPLKQLSSQRFSESEKTSPVKSILKNSNHDQTSTKANTTQHFYQNKIGDYKLQEALSIYKSLKQIMDQSNEKSTQSLLNKKTTNFMSHKGIKQQN